MNYQESERQRQLSLLLEKNTIFNNAIGDGIFAGKPRQFCLADESVDCNIFDKRAAECLDYFKKENITFWQGEGIPNHILSSQVACLNHLFFIRNDRHLVLGIARFFSRETITDVLPMECDKTKPYIAFEVTSNKDHLNERTTQRGAKCTSIDACILAVKSDGSKLLLPIEWKYTEGPEYNVDRSLEPNKGSTRLKNYSLLIDESAQLKTINGGYKETIYYVEPFYQLMRQTLWAEQIIKNKDVELLKADDYIHIHIIPEGNNTLLHRKYRYTNKGLSESWIQQLTDEHKYKRIDPIEIVKIISKQDEYTDLSNYLKIRYNYSF